MVNASKAGNDVPRHITAKIREDGGVKKYLLPYVAMRSAEFIFRLNTICLERAEEIAHSISRHEIEGLNLRSLDADIDTKKFTDIDMVENKEEWITLIEFYAEQLLEEYEDFIETAMEEMQNQIEVNFEDDIVNLLNEGYPADELKTDGSEYSSYDMFGNIDEYYTLPEDFMTGRDNMLLQNLSVEDFIKLQSKPGKKLVLITNPSRAGIY